MLKRNTNIQNEKGSDVSPFLPLKNSAEMNLDRYAIIQTGGKQYFVQGAKTVMIEKIDGIEGELVTFNEVLFKKVDGNCFLGSPFLSESINGTIIKQIRGKKIIVFKFKRRNKYRKKQGHRQSYTVVRIQEIN